MISMTFRSATTEAFAHDAAAESVRISTRHPLRPESPRTFTAIAAASVALRHGIGEFTSATIRSLSPTTDRLPSSSAASAAARPSSSHVPNSSG